MPGGTTPDDMSYTVNVTNCKFKSGVFGTFDDAWDVFADGAVFNVTGCFFTAATVEGSVVSGLQAAEAIRCKANKGTEIEIIRPDSYPEWSLKALKVLFAPYAIGAKVWSEASRALGTQKMEKLAAQSLRTWMQNWRVPGWYDPESPSEK